MNFLKNAIKEKQTDNKQNRDKVDIRLKLKMLRLIRIKFYSCKTIR